MLARRELPPEFKRWNRAHRLKLALGPVGIGLRRSRLTEVLSRVPTAVRTCGPFIWQPNTATRLFEYPWAARTIASRGRALRVVEVGGGLSGMQWVLAANGHEVVNIDPGLSAAGKGWNVDPDVHQRITAAFDGDVDLRPTTIGAAGIPDRSVDVLLSISALEHMTPDDVAEFCHHARRIIRKDGVAIITADLFLDLAPFADRASNRYGRNIDVRRLVEDAGLELVEGSPSELLGYPEFARDAIQANAGRYLRGRYPAVAQCLVARPRAAQG